MLIEIVLLLMVTAAACSLPGVFLLLRRMVLMSDAISHVLLPGVVIGFLATRDLKSVWLMLGATFAGVLTVALVETLRRTGRIREDAAIGLVFPVLFAVGVLLASMYLKNTHLDVDRVLLGIPELAPRRRFSQWGIDFGPVSLLVMSGVLLLNLFLIVLFFKELKLSTFDPELASSAGFRPGLLHYGLMTLVSLTGVSAFDAAGPVLVVAFFAVPAMTAWLLTSRLWLMLILAAGFGVLGAALGTLAAFFLETSIAGTVAVMLGIQFLIVFIGQQIVQTRRRTGTIPSQGGISLAGDAGE